MKYRRKIESVFVSDFDNLFAIAHIDALIFIVIKEDKEFLFAHRERREDVEVWAN